MDLCLIARITGFHGVKGGVTVEVYSDVRGRFTTLRDVQAGPDPSRLIPLRITDVREMPQKTVFTFEGYPTRNDVEAMRGWSIYIPETEMAPPPEGRHFVHDLIGCLVHDTDGRMRGTVKDVYLMPAHDVYGVETPEREVLIPAVPEFIVSVDTDARMIVVRPVPGLFEEIDED